ncbi:MAG: hypothetical protein A4E55_00844 [Pelotomaculum sp. PtaU1.Bin035]|nr:MAG: hypothetical protein A4E55_00844 [Pelotomaculum sp. PtaU1.Bin035]
MHGVTQFTNKLIRQFVGHIQAPAFDALPHPVANNAVLSAKNKITIRRRHFSDFGQNIIIPPAGIAIGVFIKLVPFIVRRILGLASAQIGIMAVAIKIPAVTTGVTEHAVQNNSDVSPPCLDNQLLKIFLRTDDRINFIVICCVITVIAGGFKDGIKINHTDAQFFKIIQLRDNASQIPAEESPPLNFAVAVSQIVRSVFPT